MSEEIVSALGERAAISGYVAQYDFFAIKAYDALCKRDLVKIEVANNGNGILDDVYVETRDTIHVCQMKHSLLEKRAFGYKDFCEILPDIVGSWLKISKIKSKKVIPYLVSNRPISTRDSIKIGKGIKVGSFSDFEREVLIPLARGKAVAPEWKSVLFNLKRKIAEKCAVSDCDLDSFFQVFVSEFAYETELIEEQNRADVRTDNILRLCRLIQQTAASKQRKVVLSAEEIIKELHWEKGAQTIFEQKLWINEEEIIPIERTLKELEEKVQSKKSGYLFLQGSPGSGKSTTLTEWSNHTDCDTIFFYAFDFTDHSREKNFFTRGEAETMLHDFVIQLNEKEFLCDSKKIIHGDIDDLRKTFYKQLNLLHEDFIRSGVKHVLIIDGLDHVPREYSGCEHSLIESLPSVEKLAEGVIVLLGSQTFNGLKGLPHDVKREYEEDGNVILMSPLTFNDTIELAKKRFSSQKLSDEIVGGIYARSHGHPLYTNYILRSINPDGETESLLATLPVYKGDIEEYYKSLMNEETMEQLGDVLGVLSRTEGRLKMDFFGEWGLDGKQLCLLRDKISPLLAFDCEYNSFTFFHNSFRIYLIGETSKNPLTGKFDANRDINFYSKLADLYLKSKCERRIYAAPYLFYSNRLKEFLEESHPEKLWASLKDFVPHDEIVKIAILGVKAAKVHRDIYCLCRYVFMLHQLTLMEDNFSTSVSFVDKDLYEAGETNILKRLYDTPEVALEHIETMMYWAESLYMEDRPALARWMFNLCWENELSFPIPSNQGFHTSLVVERQVNDVCYMLKAAILFLPLEKIREKYLSYITKCMTEFVEMPTYYSEEELNSLFELYIGMGYASVGKWKVCEEILSTDRLLETNRVELTRYKLQQQLKVYDGQHELVRNTFADFESLLKKVNDTFSLITLAKFGVKLNIYGKKQVKEIIKRVKLEEFAEVYGSLHGVNNVECYNWIFAFLILKAFSDKNIVKSIRIPHKEKRASDKYVDLLISKIDEFAHSCANCLLGEENEVAFEKACASFLDVYIHEITLQSGPDAYLALGSTRRECIQVILRAANYLGDKYFAVAYRVFVGTLQNASLLLPSVDVIEILTTAIDLNADKRDVLEHLQRVEEGFFEYLSVDERIDGCYKLGQLYHRLGEDTHARTWYSKMIESTFGLAYRKDYQLRTYIEWLDSIVGIAGIDANGASARLKWVTQRLDHVRHTTEGGYYETIALLETSFKVGLSYGVRMLDWLWKKTQISFIAGLGGALKCILGQVGDEKNLLLAIDIFKEIYLYSAHEGERNESVQLLAQIKDKVGTILSDSAAGCIYDELDHACKTKVCSSLRPSLLAKLHDECFEDNSDRKSSMCTERNPTEVELGIVQAEKLLTEGKKKDAQTCILRTIEKAGYSGWHEYWDGGTKLQALNVLKELDEEAAYTRAFDEFVSDVCANPRHYWLDCMLSFMKFFESRYELLPAFNEFEGYMNREIRDEDVKIEDAPVFGEEEIGCNTALYQMMRIVLGFNISYFNEIIPLLIARDCSRNFCISSEAKKLLSENSPLCLRVAGLMRYVLPALFADIKSIIPLGILKRTALTLDEKLQKGGYVIGGELEERAPYEVWQNSGTPTLSNKAIIHMVVQKIKPIIERIAIYLETEESSVLNELCKILDASKTSIYSYAQLHREMLQKLDRVGLRMDWLRPGDVQLGKAIEQLLEKSLKEGLMTKEIMLSRILPNYNYAALLRNVSERPHFSKVEYTYSSEIVNAYMSAYTNREVQRYEQMSVVAEHTNVYRSAKRLSYHQHVLFGRESDRVQCDMYLAMSPYMNMDAMRNQTLIFSPELAEQLHWGVKNDKCSLWTNKKGEICARSVYWRDGNCEQYQSDSCETAEGWLLLMSDAGIKELCALLGCTELLQAKQFCIGNDSMQTGWMIEDETGNVIDELTLVPCI